MILNNFYICIIKVVSHTQLFYRVMQCSSPRNWRGDDQCMAGQNLQLRGRLELRWLAMVSNIFSTSGSIDQIIE